MRRALCVGIDNYTAGPLRGCVSDAERLCSALRCNQDGSPNFEPRLLVAPDPGPDDVVTRRVLRKQLGRLFKDPAELALLHYSGHGTVNNLDGYLVTQDAAKFDEGIAMGEVLTLANDSPADEVVVFVDCCYSGRFGNPPAIGNARVLLREGVSILTASRGDQPSVETGGGGVFTSLVLDALEGGAADIIGSVTLPAIYAYVAAALGAWDQRPLFKSHTSRLLPLRRCTPPIEQSLLRDLPLLFPLPAEDLPLDPSFEPQSARPDEGNVATFGKLQALSRG